MIEGLSHITLIVTDLERSSRMIESVLGAKRVYDSGAATFSLSPERFFVAGGVWIALMQGSGPAARTYDHLAFKVRDEDIDELERRIHALGLEIRPSRPRVAGEGRSIYFYDWDNHLLELHTGTLADRLARYRAGRQA